MGYDTKNIFGWLVAFVVGVALTVSWERIDRDREVAAQVGAEIKLLELFVDTLRPEWAKARKLSELADAVCGDWIAASQFQRVRLEKNKAGGSLEPLCGE